TERAQIWVERLTAAGAGVGAHVHMTFDELFDDERTRRRGLSIVRDHPGVGPVRSPGPHARLSRTRVVPATPARPAGGDAPEILASVGWDDRLAELIGQGVIGSGGYIVEATAVSARNAQGEVRA